MVRAGKPGNAGNAAHGEPERPDPRDQELERRRHELEASLASRRAEDQAGVQAAKSGGVSGYGNALKLSSEFIAGVVVGAGLGWVIDRWAGRHGHAASRKVGPSIVGSPGRYRPDAVPATHRPGVRPPHRLLHHSITLVMA